MDRSRGDIGSVCGCGMVLDTWILGDNLLKFTMDLLEHPGRRVGGMGSICVLLSPLSFFRILGREMARLSSPQYMPPNYPGRRTKFGEVPPFAYSLSSLKSCPSVK